MNRLLLIIVGVLLIISGCGDSSGEVSTEDPGGSTTEAPEQDGGGNTADTDTTVPQTDTTQTSASSGAESPAPEVGEAGSFTVNATEFAVTLLNRCIPFSDSPGNIDLQALAQGEGAKLNLVLLGGTTEVSVDGSGIEEMFGSIAFGGDSFDDGIDDPGVHSSDVAGDRWTGSATLDDALDSGETVDVTWDVMVPAEAHDCSL